jgi:hypothetical protein
MAAVGGGRFGKPGEEATAEWLKWSALLKPDLSRSAFSWRT